jgi:hypothetical protein
VETNLARAGIKGTQRNRIVATLQSVVPKPDKQSRATAERELNESENRRKGGR